MILDAFKFTNNLFSNHFVKFVALVFPVYVIIFLVFLLMSSIPGNEFGTTTAFSFQELVTNLLTLYSVILSILLIDDICKERKRSITNYFYLGAYLYVYRFLRFNSGGTFVGDPERKKIVGVLGWSFKAENDDTRDSLSIKLLKYLKSKNLWISGFDIKSKKDFTQHDWTGNNVLLFGSEGYGLNYQTKKNSDFLFRVNINKKGERLNISNTASVVFHYINNLRKKTKV